MRERVAVGRHAWPDRIRLDLELFPAKVFRTAELPGRSCGRLRQLCRLFGVEPIPVVGTDEGKRHGGLDVVNSIASYFARFIHRCGAKG